MERYRLTLMGGLSRQVTEERLEGRGALKEVVSLPWGLEKIELLTLEWAWGWEVVPCAICLDFHWTSWQEAPLPYMAAVMRLPFCPAWGQKA